jgi:serine/threonine protein kinase/class 3 adenylate cyclase
MNTPPQPGDLPTSKSGDSDPAGQPRTRTDPGSSTEVTGSYPTHPVKSATTEVGDLPERFGRYLILRKLGRGGMGTVYLAHDTQLDRPVALKVPRIGPDQGSHVLERFAREARAAALLHHPNICPIYDVGQIDNIPYLTMAYIEGQTLAEWAAQHRGCPVQEIAALVRTLALALVDAHANHLIHRDLKPSNIMLNKRHEPVIMDFGLARRVDLGDQRLTHQGVLVGTPAYMAPEQLDPDQDALGPACDVYALGVILYELLTGKVPFEGTVTSMLAQIIAHEPKPPSHYRPELDAALDAICLKALAKDTHKRFADMAEFAEALDAYLRRQDTLSLSSGPSCPPDLDIDLAGEVLHLLCTWGWAAGLRKLKIRIQETDSHRLRAALQAYADWLAGDRNLYAEAMDRLKSEPHGPALAGWALAAQAIVALRERNHARVHQLLDKADAERSPEDRALAATIAHTRGAAYFHQGRADLALPELHEALALFGKEHFATGRVLDTLGMVYAGKGNFHIAREFYEQALKHKQRFDDESGLALSHGQLGRLHLDWGQLDQAEEHFQEDLRLAQKILDSRAEAQMYNHLGQVALARAEREAAAGRRATARRLATEAAGWLEESIRLCQEFKLQVAEGYARKDRALVYLLEGNIASAEQQAQRAEELFKAAHFTEGTAQVNRVWGMILRSQEHFEEALRTLRAALTHFEDARDAAETARIQGEIARTLRASGTHAPLVTRAFLEALERAENCRRDPLVEQIEEELREVDQEAYFRHVYCRVRGRAVSDDTTSLINGASEVVTVLCFDLQGFSDYAWGLDPQEVLMTLNQMMADLAVVLERYRAKVTTYFGDGFMALLREAKHAERAVNAALDLMAALQEFDRPREILGLRQFQARIGIHTGAAFLGNVGTYHKIDFTVLGPAVTLSSRLLNWAEPGLPCISHDTYELLPDRFAYRPGNPRTVEGPGMESCAVWDVVGWKK